MGTVVLTTFVSCEENEVLQVQSIEIVVGLLRSLWCSPSNSLRSIYFMSVQLRCKCFHSQELERVSFKGPIAFVASSLSCRLPPSFRVILNGADPNSLVEPCLI